MCVDPNVRPAVIDDADAYRARLDDWVRLAHIVKASRQDLAWLYPEDSFEWAVGRWLKMGPSLVVVTVGADGSVGFTRAEAVGAAAHRCPSWTRWGLTTHLARQCWHGSSEREDSGPNVSRRYPQRTWRVFCAMPTKCRPSRALAPGQTHHAWPSCQSDRLATADRSAQSPDR